MSRLIDRSGVRADGWVVLADAAQSPDSGADLLVPLALWRGSRERWLSHAGRIGVGLGPADDPAVLAADVDRLSLITVDFPSFTDGRGYSIARLLRERLNYRGELRAVGEILRDQLFYLARCGFDSFALRDDQDIEAALKAFADFSEVYQAAVDRGPLFARRFAAAAAGAAARSGS